MDRERALRIIKQHREELVERGVVTLSLVGSVARDEPTPDSDVDLVVRLAEGPRGLAHFRRLDELQERLGELLGCRVDLVEEEAVSQRMRRELERDRILAF